VNGCEREWKLHRARSTRESRKAEFICEILRRRKIQNNFAVLMRAALYISGSGP
jgi:hypothetical protein